MKKLVLLFVLSVFTCSYGVMAQITVTSTGSVGITTTTPAFRLDINSGESRSWYSTKQPLGFNHWGGDPRITSGSKVVFYNTTATGFIDIECRSVLTNSDKNSKENILPIGKPEALLTGENVAKISQLQGVKYTFKNDKDKKVQIGFLAQDVEAVIPEAVYTNDSTQIKSMSYNAIIPYLVEAMKEQQAQIEELKKQINK